MKKNMNIMSKNGGPGDNNFLQHGQDGDKQDQNSLKGKLTSLELQVAKLAMEMNSNIKEIQILKSEKDTLESVLQMKTFDVKKALSNELGRLEEEQNRHFEHQSSDHQRLSDQIGNLKVEKTALQSQLLAMQRRINEVEVQVGLDDKI